MKQCPFCKEQIHDDATKCRYCSSSMEAGGSTDGQKVVYVVDQGLIRFAKFSLSILAIFGIVGAFLYGFKIEEAADQVHSAKSETVKAKDDTTKAKEAAEAIRVEVEGHQTTIQSLREQISRDAEDAQSILKQIRRYERQAELTAASIETPRITDQQIRDVVEPLIFNRFKAILTPEQLAQINKPTDKPTVMLADLLEQPAIKLVRGPDAIREANDGMAVKVAILCDAVAGELPQLKNRFSEGSVISKSDPSGDHGTAVASLVAAIAPKAELLPITVIGPGTTPGSLTKAIKRAADEDARIACIPVGSAVPSDDEHAAVKYAHERGVLLIAAVGNIDFGQTNPTKQYPSGFPEVLCVASTNNQDKLARFSGFGDLVDLAAPGDQIRVLTRDGETTVMSGGSFSVAIVTGVAALALSVRNDLSPEQLEQILKQSAAAVGPSLGAGRVDAAAAVNTAKAFRN